MEENEGSLLLWGVIAKLIEKIGEELDRLNWDEGINMIADAFTEAEKSKSQPDIFFEWYQFFWRFFYRIKIMEQKQPFNSVTKTSRLENHDDAPMYMVTNYDYKMFQWCREKNLMESLSNGWFLVPVDKLSPAEKKHFESRCS